jgi:molybdate transport system substrate-binding protein
MAAIGALILAGGDLPAQAGEVKVLSAIGMRQVMLELGPGFERATGHTLAIAFDSTGLIAKRIASGETVDVVMINQSAIETLANTGRLSPGSAIARSVAAVGVRKGVKADVSTPEAFKRLLLAAKSVARPSPDVGGSSGDHIVRVLERLGIAGEVNAKSVIIVTGHSGQIAESPGDAVAKGKAEIALHQLQELLAVPGIDIAGPFPGDLQGNFTFSAAIGTNTGQAAAAKALIDFLRTPGAMRAIRAKGMEPVSP